MKKIFLYSLVGGIFVLLLLFFIVFLSSRKEYKQQGLVYIEQYKDSYRLIRDGEPFFVKGAGAVDHLRELSLAGANTVRTWDTINIGNILDTAAKYNLAVMVGLPVIGSNYTHFYENTDSVKLQFANIEKTIERYKDHPALLAWICGNELDFPTRPSYKTFYSAFNDLIEMIHRIDGNHPVTTSLVNFSKRTIVNLKLKSPELDFISINTFGGKLDMLKSDLESFQWFWNDPYLLTEWGILGYWYTWNTAWSMPYEQTSHEKAVEHKRLYENAIPHNDGRCLGSCVFYWGQKQERTYSWFSLFNKDGKKTESVSVMEALWKEQTVDSIEKYPIIDEIVFGNAKDSKNLLCKKNDTIRITLKANITDSTKILWFALYEDWFRTTHKEIKRDHIFDCQIIHNDSIHALLITPDFGGPYRLYVELEDENKRVGTANVPFYVVADE